MPNQSGEHQDPWRTSLATAVETMNLKLDDIIGRLGDGDTAIAELRIRVQFLEKIVYGMVAIILLAFIVALAASVIRQAPDSHPAAVAASKLAP